MRYPNCCFGRRLFLIALTVCITGSPSATAQLPPARSTVVGDLQLVASLAGDQPAGVAISNSGRLFVSYPRHDGDVAFTVGEIKNGHAVAYHSVDVTPLWAQTMLKTAQIGNHVFYKRDPLAQARVQQGQEDAEAQQVEGANVLVPTRVFAPGGLTGSEEIQSQIQTAGAVGDGA